MKKKLKAYVANVKHQSEEFVLVCVQEIVAAVASFFLHELFNIKKLFNFFNKKKKKL